MRRYLIPSLLLAGIALSGCSSEAPTPEVETRDAAYDLMRTAGHDPDATDQAVERVISSTCGALEAYKDAGSSGEEAAGSLMDHTGATYDEMVAIIGVSISYGCPELQEWATH